MSPLLFTLIAFAASLVAGFFGSLVGVGGGIIVVPVLTLLLDVDIKHAIGASIVCVIATSCGAAGSYVRKGIANMRLAMLLETSTAAGAVVGAFLAGLAGARALFLMFGLLLAYTAWSMSRRRVERVEPLPPDPIADRLRLHGSYYDESERREITYRVSRTPVGLAVSVIAGVVSGLLGIGGGTIKVPVMNLAMGVPLKVCTATSNFMIGVTAAVGATIYFSRGEVLPHIAAPVAVGVLLGANVGSRVLGKTKNATIRRMFVAILVVSASQMLWKGIRP